MNRETFKKEKKNIILYEAAFGLFCEVVSLFFIGLDAAFACGIVFGIITITVNLFLLENVIDMFIYSQKTWLAFLIQMGRLLLFGAVAAASFYMGFTALMGYAAGIISLVVGAGITYAKEGKRG